MQAAPLPASENGRLAEPGETTALSKANQMGEEAKDLGSEPEQLARLLSLGLEGEDQDEGASQQAKADLLRARLAGILPPETAAADELQAIVGRIRKELLPLGGKSLAEALLDPESGLAVFQKIKDYAKTLSARKTSEVEHSVAVAIYFAAIAGALLRHDKRITSRSYPALVEAFDTLIEKRWMTPELARCFAEARRYCRKKVP